MVIRNPDKMFQAVIDLPDGFSDRYVQFYVCEDDSMWLVNKCLFVCLSIKVAQQGVFDVMR